MCKEIQVLLVNKTWILVLFHPSMNVVGSQWVYRIKCNADGNIEWFKTPLVVRGFT